MEVVGWTWPCDAAAYETILRDLRRALYSRVRRLLRRYGGDDADIDDIVQETLLAFHLRRDLVDASAPLLPWLYAVARNKVVDAARRRYRWARQTIDAELMQDPREPDSVLDASDLNSLLSHLSERERGIVRHTALEGRTVDEAARNFGVSPAHARVIKHRAIRKLALMISANESLTS
jgi:RNA polymerase sigma-70 factor (ECF subfamily)